MALEGTRRQLFDEIKYKYKFPPRDAATRIKNDLAARGLGSSGALVEAVTAIYPMAAEAILDDFTESALSKRAALGIGGEAELVGAISDAYQQVFADARSHLLEEFGGQRDYGQMAIGILDGRLGPVWEHLERKVKLSALEEMTPAGKPGKEREQKFGILLSPAQTERDFKQWRQEAEAVGNPIAVFFVDIDEFKKLNATLTETKVDQTILPDVQRLLAKLVQGRGDAYRQGGEEFVLIVPNLDRAEARAFGEKVRAAFEQRIFASGDSEERITVSVGVAMWPDDGETYEAVLAAANRAEREAKKTRNSVRAAGE
jgi:diguanylate cyclase (GGDEF)-like protein